MEEMESGIDSTVLHHLLSDTLSGELSVFAEILRMFIDGTPKSVQELQEAISQKDGEKSVHISHTLKSNGLSVGARRFSAYCKEIEDRGRRGEIDGLLPLANELSKEAAICCDFLKEELKAVEKKSA